LFYLSKIYIITAIIWYIEEDKISNHERKMNIIKTAEERERNREKEREKDSRREREK